MQNYQERFNYMLSRSRMAIKNTFGRLKGRWRRLQRRIDMFMDIVPVYGYSLRLMFHVVALQFALAT